MDVITFPHFVVLGLSLTMAMTNPTFLSFGPEAGEPGLASRLSRGAGCREEEVTIQSSVCRITWEEECSVARKTVGQRMVMETECADREVMDCKTVQMVYQEFPSLGIAGGPGKAYEECGMVMRNLCEDVPNQKNVTAEVETCIQSPKEVCKVEDQKASKYICERLKPGTEE